MQIKKYAAALVLGGTLLSGGAFAVTSNPILANMAFDTPITFTNLTNINFGTLQAAIAGATYKIDTNGVVSASNSGVSLGGAQQAGSITIAGSSSQKASITIAGQTASNGVSLTDVACVYGSGAVADPCNLTAQTVATAGTVLKLGATVTADGNQAAGTTASPSFTVNVTYN